MDRSGRSFQLLLETSCILQRNKGFVVKLVGNVTRFVNLRWIFSKMQKNRPQSCAKYFVRLLLR